MPDEDEVERRLRKLSVEHAETRWLALRLDDDVKEIREELRHVRATQAEHTATLDEHTATLNEHTATLNEHTTLLTEHSTLLTEHTARFDSIDAQLRSLTRLVGEAIRHLPGQSDEGTSADR
jgi:chromosome segregation ATPase